MSDHDITCLRFRPTQGIPNNPALPVVVMRAAFVPESASATCALLEANGWTGTWVYTVFPHHHFHPDAHEALAVARGEAVLLIGGPTGRELRLKAGDTVILPAGTGHKRLSQSTDFAVCGAYPPGQSAYTTRRLGETLSGDADTIAAVPLPPTDPIHGAEGPLTRVWTAA